MTKHQFLENYVCNSKLEYPQNLDCIIISYVIRRSDNLIMDRLKTTLNIYEANNWILDSQSMASINPLNWEILIENALRGHLNYFTQRIPITDYYPLDTVENPNILDMYDE